MADNNAEELEMTENRNNYDPKTPQEMADAPWITLGMQTLLQSPKMRAFWRELRHWRYVVLSPRYRRTAASASALAYLMQHADPHNDRPVAYKVHREDPLRYSITYEKRDDTPWPLNMDQ